MKPQERDQGGAARRIRNRTPTEKLETEKLRDRKILLFHFSVPQFFCLFSSGPASLP
jgi:hypothetical protein